MNFYELFDDAILPFDIWKIIFKMLNGRFIGERIYYKCEGGCDEYFEPKSGYLNIGETCGWCWYMRNIIKVDKYKGGIVFKL